MVSYYEMQFVTFLSILAGGLAVISWGFIFELFYYNCSFYYWVVNNRK
jgi:hypothetical protein